MRANRNICANCAHYGCCDGLPSCGGQYWRNAYSTCVQCGYEFRDAGDWQSKDGEHSFCSEECLDEWMLEHPIEEEAEDETDN